MSFTQKYLKYKSKYLELKGGAAAATCVNQDIKDVEKLVKRAESAAERIEAAVGHIINMPPLDHASRRRTRHFPTAAAVEPPIPFSMAPVFNPPVPPVYTSEENSLDSVPPIRPVRPVWEIGVAPRRLPTDHSHHRLGRIRHVD